MGHGAASVKPQFLKNLSRVWSHLDQASSGASSGGTTGIQIGDDAQQEESFPQERDCGESQQLEQQKEEQAGQGPHANGTEAKADAKQFCVSRETWGADTTILIDDSPEKCVRNPPFTAIHPSSWSMVVPPRKKQTENGDDSLSTRDQGGEGIVKDTSVQVVAEQTEDDLEAAPNSPAAGEADVDDLIPDQGKLWRYLVALSECEGSAADFIQANPFDTYR